MSENVLSARAQELKKMLEEKGVNETRLNRLQSAFGANDNTLPKSGTFDKVEWNETSNEARFHHFRIKTTDGKHSCSLSVLQGQGQEKTDNIAVIKTNEGKYAIKVSAINRDLSRLSQLELAAFLEGKKFKAKEADYLVRPFDTEAQSYTRYDSEDEARQDAGIKKMFVLTVED